MKSILLCGAPRSGKTKLAERLYTETGASLISGDFLVSAFEGIFPELGIFHEEENRSVTSEKLLVRPL